MAGTPSKLAPLGVAGVAALALGSTGCEPNTGSGSKGIAGEVQEDTGTDGRSASDRPIELTADAPAFYADAGPIWVSGQIVDGSIGEIAVLTINGENAVVGAGRTFSGSVDLPEGVPWKVVDIYVEDDTGRSGTIQVQVGRAAAASTTQNSDGLATHVGPDALNTLALHVASFVRPESLAPPEGTLFERTCDPINEPEAELGQVTEVLRLTGTARLVSFSAAVDTDDEALHLDLQGTVVGWGAEVVSTLDGETFTRQAELLLELGRADDLPANPCGAGWAAVRRAPEPATWSAEFAWPPSCFAAEDAGLAAASLYPASVPPELDRASCAWADWLEDALATELTGHTALATPTIDRAGMALGHTVEARTAAPFVTTERPTDPTGDGLRAVLGPALVGPALQAAATLDRTELGNTEEDGEVVAWSRLAPAGGVTTLAANDAGALGVLPVPVGFRIERDGSVCATGHVIPGPTSAAVDDTPDGTSIQVAPAAVGADVVNTCNIETAQWQAILTDVVDSAFSGSPAQLQPAVGLMLLGAEHTATVDHTGVQTDLDVPLP